MNGSKPLVINTQDNPEQIDYTFLGAVDLIALLKCLPGVYVFVNSLLKW